MFAKTQVSHHRGQLSSAIFLLAALPAMGETREPVIGGTVGISSDYVFRGVSQTLGYPALQASLDVSLPSGFYGYLWGSNVEFETDDGSDDGASFEINVAAGYAREITDTLSFEVEYVRYLFPSTAPGVDYDYDELTTVLHFDERISAAVGLTNNVDGTGEPSQFYAVCADFGLADDTNLSLEFGYNDLTTAYGHAYSYSKTTVSRDFDRAALAIAYVDTYGAADKIFGDQVTRSRFVLSLQLDW
jgi:uncharacterized protein (TIGR02001 family)